MKRVILKDWQVNTMRDYTEATISHDGFVFLYRYQEYGNGVISHSFTLEPEATKKLIEALKEMK